MNSKIIIGIIVIVVVLGAILLGSNKKGGSQTTPQTTEQTQPVKPSVTTQAKTTQAQTQEAAVAITSSGFEPATITIKVGTKVVWTNKSGGPATVNSDLHPTHLIYPPLNLGSMDDGGSKELVFDKPGTYKYHDHLNPSLTGTVVVE